MGDPTCKGVISGLLKTQKLFQNGKSVLPGSVDLKHESGISVDIICDVAVIKSNHQSGDLSQPFFFFCRTDLDHRMRQHKASLLYTEAYEDKHEAAKRERQIKGWRRQKKLSLIKKGNQVRG